MGETIHRPVTCTSTACPHYSNCVQMPSSNYFNDSGSIDVVVVGQGAGWQEEHNKRSWCGKAGQLLRHILRDIRQEHMHPYGISLTNTVRCRPTEMVDGKLSDRPPTKAELDFCMPYLRRDIIELHPKVLLLMGGSSASAFGFEGSVTSLRGREQVVTVDGNNYPAIITFHPAGVLRQPGLGRDMRRDIERAFNIARESPKS